MVALVLVLVAVTGMLAPETLNKSLGDLKDAVLYKGHKEEGVLGSRRTPWEKSIASIKEHPWFGTGYGTSPTGEDPGLDFGTVASSAETAREHGSSYMTIAEWVGLLGVLPFVALLAVTRVERMESLRVDEANRRPTPLLDSRWPWWCYPVWSMPPSKIGFLPWVLISVCFFGFLHLYSRILSPAACCGSSRQRCFPSSPSVASRFWSRRAQPMIRLFINGLAASAGGGLTYLRNVIPHLARRTDAQTTVLTNPELRREFGELPNVSFAEAAESSGVFRRFVREQTGLPKLIRRSGAQVLISAGNFALWNSPVPQILLSRNSLYTSGDFLRDVRARGDYAIWADTLVKGWLARRSIGCADITVAPSEAFAQELSQWSGKKVLSLHHGFDRDAFTSDTTPLATGSERLRLSKTKTLCACFL